MPLSNAPRPHLDPLTRQPLPQLACALSSRIPTILRLWSIEVRMLIPHVKDFPFDELIDNLPIILPQIADALDSADEAAIEALTEKSPAQGRTRFRQQYAMQEVMLEDRLLRKIIVEEVEHELRRPMMMLEQVALHAAIDEMLQQALIAFVDEQKAQFRIAAESELKYLSFLSHDLNNNLATVTLWLQLLKARLVTADLGDDVKYVESAQAAISNTLGGMDRLLRSEQLRKSGAKAERRPVNLRMLTERFVSQAKSIAESKGIVIVVDVPADVIVESDGELIGLILQNLVGNALIYSTTGTIAIGVEQCRTFWKLAVADQGPGIDRDHFDVIFKAFHRGEAHGQEGIGLGLTIASQAAELLGGSLTVDSTVGEGSVFAVTVPQANGKH